jgi:uncharacterized membrane protein YkgB
MGYADCLLASSQRNLYVLRCVQCQTHDDGQRNWPKHVEFYSKNKFEKLVYLIGFIIRILVVLVSVVAKILTICLLNTSQKC